MASWNEKRQAVDLSPEEKKQHQDLGKWYKCYCTTILGPRMTLARMRAPRAGDVFQYLMCQVARRRNTIIDLPDGEIESVAETIFNMRPSQFVKGLEALHGALRDGNPMELAFEWDPESKRAKVLNFDPWRDEYWIKAERDNRAAAEQRANDRAEGDAGDEAVQPPPQRRPRKPRPIDYERGKHDHEPWGGNVNTAPGARDSSISSEIRTPESLRTSPEGVLPVSGASLYAESESESDIPPSGENGIGRSSEESEGTTTTTTKAKGKAVGGGKRKTAHEKKRDSPDSLRTVSGHSNPVAPQSVPAPAQRGLGDLTLDEHREAAGKWFAGLAADRLTLEELGRAYPRVAEVKGIARLIADAGTWAWANIEQVLEYAHQRRHRTIEPSLLNLVRSFAKRDEEEIEKEARRLAANRAAAAHGEARREEAAKRPIPAEAIAHAGLWADILAGMDVDATARETWLEKLLCQGLGAEGVWLVAPSSFIANWLRGVYVEQIAEAVRDALDLEREPEVFVTVDESEAAMADAGGARSAWEEED